LFASSVPVKIVVTLCPDACSNCGTSSAFSKFESYQAALSSLWVQV
jgi:hypothetical protein